MNKLNKTLFFTYIKSPEKQREINQLALDKIKNKFKPKRTTPCPSQKTLAAINLWNSYAKDYPTLYIKINKSARTETYKKTWRALNAFFNGTLFMKSKTILPPKIKPFTKKYTLDDFEIYIARLHAQMVDLNLGKGFKPFTDKANLFVFLCGVFYNARPSILLEYCLEEPVTKKSLEYPSEVKYLQNLYKRKFESTVVFASWDIAAFDFCCMWAIPYAESLDKNFNPSMGGHRLVFNAILREMSICNTADTIKPVFIKNPYLENRVKRRIQKLGYKI